MKRSWYRGRLQGLAGCVVLLRLAYVQLHIAVVTPPNTANMKENQHEDHKLRLTKTDFEEECVFWSDPNRTARSFLCETNCSSLVLHYRSNTKAGLWCQKNCPANCEWFPAKREDRFPTVEDRVRIYMHQWYHPCKRRFNYTRDESGSYPVVTVHGNNTSEDTVIDTVVGYDKLLLLDMSCALDCAGIKRDVGKRNTSCYILHPNARPYCLDVIDLLEMSDQINANSSSPTPVVSFFGDNPAINKHNNGTPLIGKWRYVMTRQERDIMSGKRDCEGHGLTREAQPIIWKLESDRHWHPVEYSIEYDTPWERKVALAIWRGAFTGAAHYTTSSRNMTDLNHCLINQRCRFVMQHMKSKLVDAGIDDTVNLINKVIDGVSITKTKANMHELQGHKVLISLEGNDVASGLKWNLLSQSVVLMPKPTKTSWAMEELLEPWVHYIPMKDDGSDADAMVQWVVDHDQKAKEISQRATLFMYDLLYHPLSEKENLEVKQEIVRRYHQWWL
jgi:hypothetical protein